MSTMNHEVIAALRERLHDLMLGYARTEAVEMQALAASNWAVAARIEQLRRQPLVRAFDDELLAAIAARALDPSVEAHYLAARLRDAEDEARAESAGVAVPAAGTTLQEAPLPATAPDLIEATVALIAHRRLGFEVLHARNADSMDFRECSVWSIRAALVEAYQAGWHAAR